MILFRLACILLPLRLLNSKASNWDTTGAKVTSFLSNPLFWRKRAFRTAGSFSTKRARVSLFRGKRLLWALPLPGPHGNEEAEEKADGGCSSLSLSASLGSAIDGGGGGGDVKTAAEATSLSSLHSNQVRPPTTGETKRGRERTNRPRPGDRGDPGRSSSPGGHPDYPDRGGRREKLNNTV